MQISKSFRRFAFKSFYLVFCLVVFPTVNGCGQLQAGREKTINFTLSDFKLPAVMAYTDDVVARMNFPGISSTENQAKTYVRRLIMGAVEDVLYEQGRSALLSDNVISLILQQLDIQIRYEPLKCENVISPMGMAGVGMKENCIVADGKITNICKGTGPDHCSNAVMVGMHTMPVPAKHFSISGSLTTSNAIMANWSNQMWQSILNRVLRKLISAGSNFYGASVNIG